MADIEKIVTEHGANMANSVNQFWYDFMIADLESGIPLNKERLDNIKGIAEATIERYS